MTDASTEAPIVVAEPAPTLSAPVEAANQPPELGIDAREEAAGRKEPTFDEPVRPAIVTPAAAAAQKAHIRLRPSRPGSKRVASTRCGPIRR